MAFKKIILVLPAEGYIGETVEHTVTKTNLTNQPELAEAGIKEGDKIQVMPKEENPNKAVKPQVDTDPVTSDNDSKSYQRAAEIAEKLGVEKVFENKDTGEFFTSENLALLSTKQDKNRVKTHNF